MTKAVRLGVIGLGKMGLSHLAIANRLAEFEVLAVSDLNRLVGRSVARYSNATYHRDYRHLLRDSEVEAVLISVPTHLHYSIGKAALEEGKHVFLEKPLTLSPETSHELVELAADSGLSTQVGYVNRASPVFSHFRQLMAMETYGTPFHFECAMRGNVVGDVGAQGWRDDHSFGGGCLYEYGSHSIDLELFLFGPVASIDHTELEARSSAGVEDVVRARLTHTSGLTGNLLVDWADPSQRKASNVVTVVTDRATLRADKQEIHVYQHTPRDLEEAMAWTSSNEPDERISVTDLNTDVPYYLRGEDFTRQLVDFHRLIRRKDGSAMAQFADGYITDCLIDELFRQGRSV